MCDIKIIFENIRIFRIITKSITYFFGCLLISSVRLEASDKSTDFEIEEFANLLPSVFIREIEHKQVPKELVVWIEGLVALNKVELAKAHFNDIYDANPLSKGKFFGYFIRFLLNKGLEDDAYDIAQNIDLSVSNLITACDIYHVTSALIDLEMHDIANTFVSNAMLEVTEKWIPAPDLTNDELLRSSAIALTMLGRHTESTKILTHRRSGELDFELEGLNNPDSKLIHRALKEMSITCVKKGLIPVAKEYLEKMEDLPKYELVDCKNWTPDSGYFIDVGIIGYIRRESIVSAYLNDVQKSKSLLTSIMALTPAFDCLNYVTASKYFYKSIEAYLEVSNELLDRGEIELSYIFWTSAFNLYFTASKNDNSLIGSDEYTINGHSILFEIALAAFYRDDSVRFKEAVDQMKLNTVKPYVASDLLEIIQWRAISLNREYTSYWKTVANTLLDDQDSQFYHKLYESTLIRFININGRKNLELLLPYFEKGIPQPSKLFLLSSIYAAIGNEEKSRTTYQLARKALNSSKSNSTNPLIENTYRSNLRELAEFLMENDKSHAVQNTPDFIASSFNAVSMIVITENIKLIQNVYHESKQNLEENWDEAKLLLEHLPYELKVLEIQNIIENNIEFARRHYHDIIKLFNDVLKEYAKLHNYDFEINTLKYRQYFSSLRRVCQ